MRDRCTRVLKGHIAIARAIFPEGTTGAQLDSFARQFLWAQGLDFDHGTGHGVGSYLSVHEGPARISKLGTTALKPGMILSNEPGYYKTGAYGIRIEKLVLVVRTREDWAKGAARRTSRRLLALLIAMGGVSSLSLNILVQALPGLAAKLAADSASVQLAVSPSMSWGLPPRGSIRFDSSSSGFIVQKRSPDGKLQPEPVTEGEGMRPGTTR
jgi:Metallopeptidase family M24